MESPGPDVDRGPQLAATYIAGCVVSLVFVALRLCARFSIAGYGADDALMLLTWIIFVPLTIMICILSFSGGTRHLYYLIQANEQAYALKLNWIAQPLAIFCLGSGKVAVALLIIRLLNRASVWRRWSLYLLSALTVVNTILMIVFTFVQCEDPAALWDDRVRAKTKCWDPRIQSTFSIYGASIHAVMDFFLAVLPISLVWGLKTDVQKKIGLCLLLGCGSLTGICAAIKATKLSTLNARSDFTWETFTLFMWTGIEIILTLVCGSIPALKPLYGLCMGVRPGSSNRGTRRYTLGSTASKKGQPKRSYIKQQDNENDSSHALGPIQGQNGTVVSTRRQSDSDDEIGLAISDDLEKGTTDHIYITQTVEVQRVTRDLSMESQRQHSR